MKTMEEQILKIISCDGKLIEESGSIDMWYPKETAKEIADHFKRFMEWVFTNERFIRTTDRDLDNNVLAWYFMDYGTQENMKHYDLDELYQYWSDNINDKK